MYIVWVEEEKIINKNGDIKMVKSLLLGIIISVIGFMVCIFIARSQGIAYAMSFAAMLLVGVVIAYLNLILTAIKARNYK